MNKFICLILIMIIWVPDILADDPTRLHELTVSGRRQMKEIGIQQTKIDSAALKDNIALSMADILTYNTSVFVKSYGRATLSTVAFRGTSPSHTQVTWNGMRIANPMLGMTDFSTIPSYFIDNATMLHGASSVNESGGGLGGLVQLGTMPGAGEGFHLQYVQGIGSFRTFDEFARLSYGSKQWHTSTRIVLSSSPNDYKYINHDKKINIYDEEHNIVGQYHPTERNRSGAFRDLHILEEIYYDSDKGDRLGLAAWYINSNRELPLLTTDYGNEREFENKQREQTVRAVISWDHGRDTWSLTAKAGYIHSRLAYDYRREITESNWIQMTRSRSRINTLYGQINGGYSPCRNWFVNAGLSAHQQFVLSHDKNIIMQDGDKAIVGYDRSRIELSGSASAKWQPYDRIGLSLVIREDMYGDRWAPLIPAFFMDALLSKRGNIMAKASVTRNYRFPTLNDLYFLPGGNPNLKNEHGLSYDTGLSFATEATDKWSINGSASWFDSYIDDWIIWLPTTKGFFTPRNVKKVHSYGVEISSGLVFRPHAHWTLELNGSYSWTPSINRSNPVSAADQSVGKQLPYVPRHSASATGRLSWNNWSMLYKWVFYSERYTMSSNDYSLSGHLPPYFMNNLSLEKQFNLRDMSFQLKLIINNLFNEDYLSVLSHPMPGINFEFFFGVSI